MKYFIILLFIALQLNSFAQGTDAQIRIEKEFDTAVKLFQSGSFDDAKVIFNRIANDYKINNRTTASEFFISKILIEQKKYSLAQGNIERVLQYYPNSEYESDFRKLLIQVNLNQFNYEDAFRESIKLFQKEDNEYSRTLLERIALNHLSSKKVKDISGRFDNSDIKPFLLFILGKVYLLENDNENSFKSFNEVASKYPNSNYYNDAAQLKSGISTGSKTTGSNVVIGVMLPLTDDKGSETIAGHEILEGIKFAVSEYNKNRNDKIGILVRDTKSKEEIISRIQDEFSSNSSVRCVLGPIFSDEVRFAINEFQNSDLPMISPTATDGDLTTISSNFFQANPTFSVRGKIFAQYIYFVENKRKMAILNSIDGYSPLLASSFAEEFERLGGRIVIRESYKSNSLSLNEQISNISRQASVIEGIYIPLADKADATAILSKLAQSELMIPIYGNQDWMLVKGFETSPELSNLLTFTSDYFIDYNDESFNSFSSEFQQVTGTIVNRNVLYGFDTAKYLLNVLRNIDPSRKAIKLKMESGVNSVGFKNNISFDSNRINKFINIIRYQDGIFELVDKFRSGR